MPQPPVPHPSALRFLVLHVPRLRGLADTAAIAEAIDRDPVKVGAELARLVDDGLVQERTGRLPGWVLTLEGRKEHAELAQEELAEAGARPAVDAAYRCFLELNPDLLRACTAWQLRPVGTGHQINDHADPAYDADVVRDLERLHERVRPGTALLAATLARFGSYGNRFDHALARVQAGEDEWFTRPVIDSYHSVWFELHEDLLSTLGYERASEGRA